MGLADSIGQNEAWRNCLMCNIIASIETFCGCNHKQTFIATNTITMYSSRTRMKNVQTLFHCVQTTYSSGIKTINKSKDPKRNKATKYTRTQCNIKLNLPCQITRSEKKISSETQQMQYYTRLYAYWPQQGQ